MSLTNQRPVIRWHEQIGVPTLVVSIAGRLLHKARRIEVQGESTRKMRGGK
jgi:hypothetical protein